jgi:hypothetical protein
LTPTATRAWNPRIAVASLLLLTSGLPEAASAEDTVGRPQALAISTGAYFLRLDLDGDFELEYPLYAHVSAWATDVIRGRDGELCAVAKATAPSTGHGLVLCDRNRSLAWEGTAGGDLATYFAVAVGAGPIAYHDLDGDGVRQLWKYVPALGGRDEFRVDLNQNDRWDPGDAVWLVAPELGAGTPFACDCNGDGAMELGKVLPDGVTLAIDLDGDGVWNGPGAGDALVAFCPETGPGTFLFADLDGEVGDEIVKYVPAFEGKDRFQVDANHNLRWDGTSGGDAWYLVATGAGPGTPCALDPEGDGTSALCKYQPPSLGSASSFFYLDRNGDGRWDGNAGGDFATRFLPRLLLSTEPPLVYDLAPP